MKTIIAVSKVNQYGKIIIPFNVRLKLGASVGDRIVWFEDENEEILIKLRK